MSVHSNYETMKQIIAKRDYERKLCLLKWVLRCSGPVASSEETARCLFLQGKALNVTAEYDPRVLDALSKAVKLDPKLLEAWNCLGECYWKKGDVEAARNCFTGALQHVRMPFC